MMDSYVRTHGQPPKGKQTHTARHSNARFWLEHARFKHGKRKDRFKLPLGYRSTTKVRFKALRFSKDTDFTT